ncbi:Cyclin-A2-2 [Hibiscus syriacus]|uniref:Cyclin-A2-2 n=1 Tax=Hibiscus syriacus TaxID=106335 RepID=A0A6A2WVI7_HIBSY|nr:cyclin-A2-2-like [Hibiscus syriacus]KAE8665348.1 Cyclin-A2-2 [Hibiscus syriacus]
MHRSCKRQASMNKENEPTGKVEEATGPITRARSKTLGPAGGKCSSSKQSFKQDQKRVLRLNSKRAASDEDKASVVASVGLQPKRRAVLKDVTNVCDDSLCDDCINATKIQTTEHTMTDPSENTETFEDIAMEILSPEEDVKAKLAEDLSKIRMVETQDITLPVILEERELAEPKCCGARERAVADAMPSIQASTMDVGVHSHQKKEENEVCEKLGASEEDVDIDSNLKDPQACCMYAPDIYNNMRVTEINQRPSINYMEQLHRDITPSMRGILVDWLVEVSEEYKLVPDSLYLTVSLIDRFLSQNLIEKQRLQLLGVACMLIASKYEEICAPRVEEFCFITDNTYTREEVLKTESKVLNLLYFKLSVPTTKTFLRRFIQAAQATYKVPCLELEFLAKYLAELTLLEYTFLKFLPSNIAASAVFLARWTLNQSDHPWNPTLEHYTNYKVSELKATILALEDLQLNTNGCSLNAIREKYKQQKFKCVATMTSPERVGSVFLR